MKTNLELYKTFYYVAKNNNITQAANELMVSQPAVSKAIKTLERDLNTSLFNRNKDGVTLNNAGELLYNKIHRIDCLLNIYLIPFYQQLLSKAQPFSINVLFPYHYQ